MNARYYIISWFSFYFINLYQSFSSNRHRPNKNSRIEVPEGQPESAATLNSCRSAVPGDKAIIVRPTSQREPHAEVKGKHTSKPKRSKRIDLNMFFLVGSMLFKNLITFQIFGQKFLATASSWPEAWPGLLWPRAMQTLESRTLKGGPSMGMSCLTTIKDNHKRWEIVTPTCSNLVSLPNLPLRAPERS